MNDNRPSPLQNRVTPFGDIISVSDRGMFIGNRGIIHDPATYTLLSRRWATQRWLICLCAFKERRRTIMSKNNWTELFFLDEATALAAGHRPCFECRRPDANLFRAAWSKNTGITPSANEMDHTLHIERLCRRRKRLHPLNGPWSALPDGTMITSDNQSFLVFHGSAWLWTPGGYMRGHPGMDVQMLTPPSTVHALAHGYRPVLHNSVTNF